MYTGFIFEYDSMANAENETYTKIITMELFGSSVSVELKRNHGTHCHIRIYQHYPGSVLKYSRVKK